MKIDVDEAKTLTPLSLRERAAIRILFAILHVVYPAKYEHQVNKLAEELLK